jgi:hypothetical protein
MAAVDGLGSRPAGRLSICASPGCKLSEAPVDVQGSQHKVIVQDTLKEGEAETLARAAHMTYLPPREPYILDRFLISDLAKLQ